MKPFIWIASVAAVALATAAALAGSAGASTLHKLHRGGTEHVVFVQTDNSAGNAVVAYDRANDGTLTLANSYESGGLGGALNGSVVDHLASQGSLAYDKDNGLLYAVNAGSNTVSVFSVHGDGLALRQVISSGGSFPVSVAVRGDLVFVLNAEGAGSLQEYVTEFGYLFPVPGSNRSLGLTPVTDANQFTNTPGQVAFSPDGSKLIVTTKANGNDIDVFRVGPFGHLSKSPVINSEPGTVPFAVAFDPEDNLVVANAGNNSLSTFALHANGTVTLLDSVGTAQSATCWVASARGFFYVSNAASAVESGFQEDANGHLGLLTPATSTDGGPVDAAASADGQFLYVQTGGTGTVDEFQVEANGSLTRIGSVTVAGAVAGEGIVAS